MEHTAQDSTAGSCLTPIKLNRAVSSSISGQILARKTKIQCLQISCSAPSLDLAILASSLQFIPRTQLPVAYINNLLSNNLLSDYTLTPKKDAIPTFHHVLACHCCSQHRCCHRASTMRLKLSDTQSVPEVLRRSRYLLRWRKSAGRGYYKLNWDLH